MRKGIFALLFVCCSAAQAQRLYPILFVTQTPIPYDFTAIGSVFGNHRADMQSTGRGGDLYVLYPNGALKNLTQLGGYGTASRISSRSSGAPTQSFWPKSMPQAKRRSRRPTAGPWRAPCDSPARWSRCLSTISGRCRRRSPIPRGRAMWSCAWAPDRLVRCLEKWSACYSKRSIK